MIRKRTRAVVNTSTEVKSNKKSVRQDKDSFVQDVLVAPGGARVSVTHGKKYWCSTRADGMSVESTCTVELSCDQDLKTLEIANDQASELAYVNMKKNYDRVRSDVIDFNDTEV